MNFSKFQLPRVRFALLISFSSLMIFQLLIGFKDFEDYLIAFVFVLFLNDFYVKIKKNHTPSQLNRKEKFRRHLMSFIFLILFIVPFLLDGLNVTDDTRSFIYRLGFILWAQVFLLDAFINYRQTHSRKWLLITNMAALFIIIGAFVN